MSKLLNEGKHHVIEGKAVKCDLKAELRKLYDKILDSDDGSYISDYDIEEIVDFTNDNSALKGFIGEALDICLKQDIAQYIDTSTMDIEFLTLGNGADVILYTVNGEESFSRMASVIYYNGEELAVYTPYEGNGVHIGLDTALGDEDFTPYEDKNNEEEIIEYYAQYELDNPYEIEVEIELDMDKIKNEIEMVLGK
jgi:hypothetical protein